MMPAKAPESSASWLFSQLPPCESMTSATAATSPARSSPTTVSTRVVMGSEYAGRVRDATAARTRGPWTLPSGRGRGDQERPELLAHHAPEKSAESRRHVVRVAIDEGVSDDRRAPVGA